jgi:hypothetical protein
MGVLAANVTVELSWGFKNKESGTISFADPRPGKLPVDLTGYLERLQINPHAQLALDREELRRLG